MPVAYFLARSAGGSSRTNRANIKKNSARSLAESSGTIRRAKTRGHCTRPPHPSQAGRNPHDGSSGSVRRAAPAFPVSQWLRIC